MRHFVIIHWSTRTRKLIRVCQQSCLVTAILSSPCTPTNQTCICTNAALQANVELCVMKTCTLKNALVTKNATQTTCGVVPRSSTAQYNTVSITMGALSAIFVIVRLSHKALVTVSDLGMDDWFILITLCSGLPSTVINSVGLGAHGLGRDIWTLSPDTITSFGYWFYIMEILYFAQVTLLKMSLLFFYMRIFSHNAPMRQLIWGTVAFNAVFGTTFIFLAVFQCSPISFYWTKWDQEHSGVCLNVNGIGWANAGISIILDCWMLGLPLSQISTLNLHWKKKISVALMFFVGTFVTVVSILRLQSLVQFEKSQNPTWDQFGVAVWSTVEINVGIICACLPAVRVILVRLFPKILGSTRTGGSQAAKYYVNSSSNGPRSRARTLGTETKVKTLDRESAASSSAANSPKGIMYTKEYAVDYNDETSLVPMRGLEAGSSKTSRSGSPF
ncbi:CFEM domain-containing protein [Colletotrichum navitas]|uniref:CFEM domain-containing protein n=1 Tax=Colletotrichum navitas TaxID=681940 RepID=A0AAD8V7D8_9PEZI|nr:CFEM domain-containing protein [Colletotrichum navitas]KAK1594576.1 CFEM domain-containing protein [Colletotrichum navitas]